MTRTTNARIAGSTFLLYIAAGVSSLALFGRAASGEGIAAKLAAIAQHPGEAGVVIVLAFVQCFAALILGVTLYAITREQDRDLAMLGMVCRVAEGVISGASIFNTLALIGLATATGTNAPDSGTQALGRYLLRSDIAVTATFFAVGSLLFSYLLLRGRMIPAVLAWIGVAASALLVIGLPLQAAGFLGGLITSLMWIPMLAFEVPLGVWFIFKGAAAPARAAGSAAD